MTEENNMGWVDDECAVAETVLKRIEAGTLHLGAGFGDMLSDFLKSMEHRRGRHLLEQRRWTEPQASYLAMSARFGLWLAANQVGKSEALAADVVMTARGDHKFRKVKGAPVKIAVISYSDSQIRPLMWKVWQLLDKTEVDPKLSCTEGGGLKGYKQPHIRFVAGPGAGSEIYFFTYKQGSEAIAGFTFDAVFADEPLPESIFGELAPRLLRNQGTFRLTMTTTPDAAPMNWLRVKIEADQKQAEPSWGFLRTAITEANLTPTEGLIRRPFLTQDQIDESLKDYLPDELPQRRDGAWEGVSTGRWLINYGDACKVDGSPHGRVWYVIGVDHGAGTGRQAAALIAHEEREGGKTWILDEYRATDRSTIRDDARAILDMLRNNGVEWYQVDHWVGDRAHGGDRFGNAKSNRDLLFAMSDMLNTPTGQLMARGLSFVTPRKGAGSMRRGFRLLNSMFGDDELVVHNRCQDFDESARNWCGVLQDPRKDMLDAARYAVERCRDTRLLQRVIREAGPTPHLL